MTDQHPITPSPELVERCRRKFILGKWTVEDIVKISFSEGADAEFALHWRHYLMTTDFLPPTLPEPVPIGERLPEPEDLNEDEQCWWFSGRCRSWMFLHTYTAKDIEDSPWRGLTHWLPANAIPTPTIKESLTDQTEALPDDN